MPAGVAMSDDAMLDTRFLMLVVIVLIILFPLLPFNSFPVGFRVISNI